MTAFLLAFLLPALAGQDQPLILARAGSAGCAIQIAPTATPPERHAASELARFLGEITGAGFTVEQVDTAGSGPAILVGPEAARSIIPADEIAKLGLEGYILRRRGDQLAIAGGRPRGTLYGVYSFLEDQLGCRWFTPDVARIPRKATIELPMIERTFVPRLEYRATDYPNSRDADWAVRNKINGTQTRLDAARGGKIAYGPFVHTFNSILDPKEHFDKHPEYFSEVKGKRMSGRTQLCLTNPDVLRITIETVRRWMRERPDATIFSVSQNDWYNYCTCKECSKVTEAEGSPMGVYLRFVNAVADAIQAEFPDKAVDTLAYQFTRQPPKNVTPSPNVIVRLCNIECCFAHPLAVGSEVDARNAEFAKDLARWGQLSQRLYIWDYVINYAHSVMPFPNLYTLQPNIAFFSANGVRGIYEEANYFSKGGEFAALRTWIIAKTLWDPGYDTDRAIDEFLAGYYGPAAAPIRRYIDLLHRRAREMNAHFRIFDGPSTPVFSEAFLQEASACFDEAEVLVEMEAALRHRVEVARLPVQYVQIARLAARIGESAGDRADRQTLAPLLARFDAVARREGISRISEGRAYDNWASGIRKLLDKTP